MSNAEQFWQYAEEAMRRADQSQNEKEKLALIELARTWTQAAMASKGNDHSRDGVAVDIPPEQWAPCSRAPGQARR
jgi:hypothetical protein